MPSGQIFRNSYLHQLSPDNQTARLAPLDLAFAALPPKERARVSNLGRTRYGVPAQAAPPLNVERLNDSLIDVAVNLAQRLSLEAPSGVTNIAQTGADLTGLIHNLFNTDFGDEVHHRVKNVPTDLRGVLDEGNRNNGVGRLVEQGISVLPFDILQYRVAGKLSGGGATYNVLAGAALAANQGPQPALEAGSKGAVLDEAREEAGRLAAFISQ